MANDNLGWRTIRGKDLVFLCVVRFRNSNDAAAVLYAYGGVKAVNMLSLKTEVSEEDTMPQEEPRGSMGLVVWGVVILILFVWFLKGCPLAG